jgi:RNA polymerase sigma factor (sigma-70 family)
MDYMEIPLSIAFWRPPCLPSASVNHTTATTGTGAREDEAARKETGDNAAASAGMPGRAPAGAFVTTHWSVVQAAGRGSDTGRARDALARLCQTYWHPLYAYARRLGHSPHDAQDLTQEFFARLLARNFLAGADESRGRFRSFLLASFKHFLANEWDKARAQKRGGGQIPIPIDVASAETSYRPDGFQINTVEPADPATADKAFERRWALTLLDQVLRRLRGEYEGSGRRELFEQLKPTLTEASRTVRYAEMASRLGTTEGAVKVAVHRLRQQYRDLLRAEIAETVSGPEEVDDELRNLFQALAG